MQARLVQFGELEIDGKSYDCDVVIEAGKIRKRKKVPSKAYKAEYGHTPLSAAEDIPWKGKQLIIGAGAYSRLPIMPEVKQLALERGVEIIARTTPETCQLLEQLEEARINAILHVTC